MGSTIQIPFLSPRRRPGSSIDARAKVPIINQPIRPLPINYHKVRKEEEGQRLRGSGSQSSRTGDALLRPGSNSRDSRTDEERGLMGKNSMSEGEESDSLYSGKGNEGKMQGAKQCNDVKGFTIPIAKPASRELCSSLVTLYSPSRYVTPTALVALLLGSVLALSLNDASSNLLIEFF